MGRIWVVMDNREYNNFLEAACEIASVLQRVQAFRDGEITQDADGRLQFDDRGLLKAYIDQPDYADYAVKTLESFSNMYFKEEKGSENLEKHQ